MIVGQRRTYFFINKRVLFFYLFSFVFSVAFGQTDLTQYATPDLFKAKAIGTTSMASANSDLHYMEVVFQEELEEGIVFWQNNQLDDAAHHFEVMIDQYPEISILHYLNGAVMYDAKKYDAAIESLNKALRLDPMYLESRYLIGRIQIDKNELKMAKETMELLLNVPKYEAYGYNGLGMVASEEKNYFKASRMYEKSLKADSSFKESYIPLTYIELGLGGSIKRITNRMDRAVDMDSLWQEARIIRALLSLAKDGNTKQFDKDINILLLQAPENYHYYFIRGYLDIELKNYRNAVTNFRIAYNLSTDSISVGEFKFSTITRRNKALQSSLNYYHNQSNIIQENARNYIDRGICEFIAEKKNNALTYYDSAYSIEESSVIDFLQGVVYESLWDGDLAAIESYSKSIDKDSTNYWAYSNRVQLNIKNKNRQLAYEDCTRMIEINPKIKDGFKIRGVLFMEDNQFIRAYRDFTRAIAYDTTDSDLYFNRGGAAFYAEYYDEALKDYTKVLQKKPKDGEAYYMVSRVYLQKHDTLLSITMLDSASKFNKYETAYHKELYQLAKENNLNQTMESALNRLVKYNGYDDNNFLERGRYYYNDKNFDKALKDLRVFVDRNKDDGEGFYYLGKTQIELGDLKAGNKSIERAKKLGFE